jgi:hypothetical protein
MGRGARRLKFGTNATIAMLVSRLSIIKFGTANRRSASKYLARNKCEFWQTEPDAVRTPFSARRADCWHLQCRQRRRIRTDRRCLARLAAEGRCAGRPAVHVALALSRKVKMPPCHLARHGAYRSYSAANVTALDRPAIARGFDCLRADAEQCNAKD